MSGFENVYNGISISKQLVQYIKKVFILPTQVLHPCLKLASLLFKHISPRGMLYSQNFPIDDGAIEHLFPRYPGIPRGYKFKTMYMEMSIYNRLIIDFIDIVVV